MACLQRVARNTFKSVAVGIFFVFFVDNLVDKNIQKDILSIFICVFLKYLQVPRHMTADVGKELLGYVKNQSGVIFR